MSEAAPTPDSTSPEWFSPTWGRWVFALALAIGGFLLPQEVPLEWYPLNEPGQDILYLEITCAADKNGFFEIYYNTTDGINELDKIYVPISPTTQTFTYTFPLKDAPITELRLDPVADGGTLTIRQMRIIDRRSTEVRRFTRDMFTPLHEIAAIQSASDGWTITSTPGNNDPYTRINLPAPLYAVGLNGRNLQRCLLSSGYLAMMLWILLLAVLFTFWRPKSWRDFFRHVGFMAAIALPFSLVGNRGLIRHSFHYARFTLPAPSPALNLEMDLASDHPTPAQLFRDTGHGYNETESVRIGYEPVAGLQTLRFPLPPGPLRALRFDPFDAPGRLDIRGIRLVGTDGITHAVLPLDSLVPQRDIARLGEDGGFLRLQTPPEARDPILEFSPSALAEINRSLATRR
ncbi:MAG: hypothetical protein HYV95_12470 [Opitutae bacterium]|nr:hypothetical protein [Opitutae bacterium]